MNLYNKLKTGISTVLLGTAIYASAVLPVQAQEVQRQLPYAIQRLSEEDQEMYKMNPEAFGDYFTIYRIAEKDGEISELEKSMIEVVLKKRRKENFKILPKFEEYRHLFSQLTNDGIITSTDVEKLERKLTEAVSSFDYERLNMTTQEINSDNENLYFYSLRKTDLELLRKALQEKEYRLKRGYDDGSYLNAGVVGYSTEAVDSLYQKSLREVFNKEFYLFAQPKKYELSKLTDEIPLKTKIPFWPGFLFGLTPLLASVVGLMKRKKTHTADFLRAPLIHILGSVIFDGIHPAVYPIRVGGGLAWEGIKTYAYNKKNAVQQPQQQTPQNNPVQNNPAITNTIDPWCELTDPEQKTIDPWTKLESIAQ
ncbi:hypothetical protein HZA97_04660 [Candidatus Woesearchaeota archaeon]|nr:hypothetical protein [Candidatus Woesearchaeota archaeon]